MRNRFIEVRNRTEEICAHLITEDYIVQPAVFVSPPKWHLAHTTWFFEQFVLVPNAKGYRVFNERFAYLFNSYYNNVGDRVLRDQRGFMTRPSVEEVYAYRKYVTEQVVSFIELAPQQELLDIIELGLNHEEQHQELLAYDLKYILGQQPYAPACQAVIDGWRPIQEKMEFVQLSGGQYEIGYKGQGFCFDNELGVHQVTLQDVELANRLVSNEEYLTFIEAGGYQNFNLWHAEGWDFIQKEQIKAPLYWKQKNDSWWQYTSDGWQPLRPDWPAMHISYYEAAAYAEWKGMRLPTEFEWELAAEKLDWGELWEWTSSAYQPYPNYTKKPGALGEYNGKFMVNQQVLRGASRATPAGHARSTYRNFFSADMRWMFAGIRLAR